MINVQSTKDISANKINCLIYGESGVGKTTLASTLNDKTIVLSMESGLLSLKSFDIDYVEIKSLDDLKDALTEIKNSDYDSVYIDSLTEISQLFLEASKVVYPDDRQTMKMYGYLLEKMTAFIKFCRDFDKNIFFTALQKTTTDDIGRRFHIPDLVGSISAKCPAYFDFVFNYQVIKKDDEEKRVLITGKSDSAIAKDRSGKLDLYERPDLGNIINRVFTLGEQRELI